MTKSLLTESNDVHGCEGAVKGETEITAVPLSRFRYTREACAGLRAGTA